MLGSSRWRRNRLLRVSVAVGLAIVGVLLVWAALPKASAPDQALAGAPPSASSTPSTSQSAARSTPRPSAAGADQKRIPDKVTGLVLPESIPVSLSIPRIGVRTSLVKLGLDGNGTMKTPSDPAQAGWFDRSPTPGALGPAVIAGHVTYNVPAVFYRLGSLQPGDEVSVTREDGKTAVFSVTRIATFSQSKFPSQAVYGPIDHAGLRLITCGGTYDRARHKYLSNVVVFAKLVAAHSSHG
jgi:sortase (surface protein transpeptidase)